MRAVRVVTAVLAVLAITAAVLVVGRLFTHTYTPAAAKASGQPPSAVELAQLEARALHIRTFKSRDDCITGPVYPNAGGGFGAGPVYVQGGPSVSTAWGDYFHVFAFADTPVKGPVLLRAVHLFAPSPVVFVGPSAAGPVVGTDTVDGRRVQQHTEALIDTSTAPRDPGPPWEMQDLGVTHPFQWPLIAAEPKGSTSSGWQVDGPGFSETFVVC